MPKNNEIENIIKKYVQDKCTPEEIELLINYFKVSKNTSEVPSVEEVNLWLKKPPKMETKVADKMYNLIVSSPKGNTIFKTTPTKRQRKIWKYSSIAAMIIGILLGGYYTMMSEHNGLSQTTNAIDYSNLTTLDLGDKRVEVIDPWEDKQIHDTNGNIIGRQIKNSLVYNTGNEHHTLNYNILKVPYGKRFNLILSDGTMVYLNSGTSIKYPVKFANKGNRQVYLSGEAFFEVTENKEKPFIVATDEGMKVKVLGTSFNVKSYPEDGNIETTLIKGKVRIMEQNLSKEVDLSPSEKAIYHKVENEVVIEGVDPNRFTSWKEGVLIYDETPMSQVIKDLERTYNVIFEVESNTILNYKYKGIFDNLTIDRVLKMFELSSPITCYMINNKIILKEDNK
ncbi:MAG: FecR family protein [Flavobacteriaceae bacterium]